MALPRGFNLSRAQLAQLAALPQPLMQAALQQFVAQQNAAQIGAQRVNKALEQEIKLQGQVATAATTADERRLKNLKSINEGLEKQQQNLEKINLLLSRPDLIRRQTAADLNLEAAQKQLTFAQTRERARQQGPLGAIADFFGFGGGGRIGGFLNKAGGTLAGIGDAMGGKLGGLLGKAGGFLGGAAAGPIGIAVSAALALAPVVRKLAAAPFQMIAGGMGMVNKALGGLTSKLGPITSILGGASEGLSKFSEKMKFISPVLSGVAAGMSEIIKQFEAFLNVAVDLVAKASPGTIRRLQFAVDDTAAVVGHRLIPVVDLMRTVIRGIGDFLQTVLPHPNEIRAALAPLSEALNELRPAFAEIAGFIRANFVIALKFLAANLKLAAAALRVLLAPLTALGRLRGAELDTSVGAAARSASFTTPEDYANQVRIAALTSEGASPVQRTADNTDRMVDLLAAIRDGLLNAAVPGAAQAAAWARGALGG